VAPLTQRGGESVDVGGPLGQHQAVPSPAQRLGDVVGNLPGAGVVGDQVAVDGGDPARRRRIGVSRVAEACRVQAKDRGRV
jgi:hypothetical protein